jgi:peptidyl-prolyl cis-trans isomerase SurA
MTIRKPFLSLAISLILISSPAIGAVVDKIAVVVNGEIITQGEIEKLMIPVYEQTRRMYKGKELLNRLEEARQDIVQQLIEERLITSEAKRLNLEVDDQEVEDKINESVKRFGSRAALEGALKEQRITMKELRAKYREQIMNRRLIDQKVGAKITVSPTEIEDYYNSHPEQFIQPESVKLRNILIKPKSDADAPKALKQANEILRRLKEGCDFEGLARTYSEGPGADEGGIMGYAGRGDLLPEIEKAVFSVKEGEVTDIVKTQMGYHIFKVEERRQSEPLKLSQVRRDVEEAIFREKMRQKLKGWLEGLKKNAYIAFK